MQFSISVASNIVSNIANLVVGLVVGSIGSGIQYAFNYKDNISKLKEEVDLLKDAEVSVEHRVEEATTRHGEEIEPGVDNWIKKAHAATEEGGKVLDRAKKNKCFMGLCPDFKTRYKLSRNAEEHTQACVKLRGEGKFDRVSYYKPPKHLITAGDYGAFDSRTVVLEEIIEVLRDSDVYMLGVCGMGGVGKTTLVKKIAEHVMEDGLFQVVVLAVVAQKPDRIRIQEEIAYGLDFEFGNVQILARRADRLREMLKKKERVLVILDDIWESIDLQELGVPYGNDHKGCKILMTSRHQNVLANEMGTQKDFLLQVLEDSEAWHLFRNTVGDVVDDPKLQSIAPQVAKRCAGLPVLLVTVAKALKSGELYAWKDALEWLKRFDDAGINDKVSSALELSYNFLRGEEIKSLFLLCSQYNPNFIDIADLLMYAFGLGIFKQGYTLENVRNRLYTLLAKLKACCLLMEHNDNRYVKMHDVVRRFGVRVASRDHDVFTQARGTRLTEWPAQDEFERFTAIFLSYCEIPPLPEILECPNLKSFTLESIDPSLKMPDEFFSRMKNLQVLDLTLLDFSSSLPSSLKFLDNLRTLCFFSCQLQDIAIIGELQKLQVLGFWGSNIVQLPAEIGKLTRLQLLNLKDCLGLREIAPCVLSHLTQMEELCMENCFVRWEVEGEQDQGSHANLAELKFLPKLITLDIHITDVKMLPKDLFPRKLERFRIFIGDGWDWSGKYETTTTLKLKLNTSIQLEDGIKALIERTEDLYLDSLMGVKNILYELDPHGLPQMKHLHVQNSSETQHLANTMGMSSRDAFPRLESLFLLNLNNLEKICLGHLTAESFRNLRKIEVGNCGKLKNLFSFSMAKHLLRLEEIRVTDCESMEEIVNVEESEPDANHDEPIKLTHLRELKLEYLPRFTCFCFELESTSLSQARQNPVGYNEIVSERELGTSVPVFNDKVVFPNLDRLELLSIKVENIWYDKFLETSSHFQRLAILKVVECVNLKHLFSHSMVESLARLKQLEIIDCKFMEAIIMAEGVGGEKMSKVLFPKLSWLKLRNLPNVKQFCAGHLLDCPSLKVLRIDNCRLLKAFISDSTSTEMEANNQREMNNSILFDGKVMFPNLDVLYIDLMPKLNEIWHNELRADSFSKLRSFQVYRCQDLVNIFPSSMLTRLQNLEDLTIGHCSSLEKVFDLINLSNTQIVAAIQLKNLRSVQIWNCERLKSFFPVSIAISLLKLEKLSIFGSTVLEEIVAKEEGVEEAHKFLFPPKFLFPRLKSLELQLLLKLSSFYPGSHSLECPVLETLNVYHCHRLQTYDSGVLHNAQETHTENQQLESHFHQLPLFSFTKVISKLEMLSVNSEEATMICQGQFLANLFDKIKTLHLCCFHDKDKLVDFPFALLQKFHNLERLSVQDCNFEEIFTCGIVGDEKYTKTLSQIKHLELRYLPYMKRIRNEESPLEQLLPSLATLTVKQCFRLINLLPSLTSFKTLTTLDIWQCHELINLVTSATAKSLVQLTKLVVTDCKKVTEIVANAGDEIESEIVFTKLESLMLWNLPNFRSFSIGICTIKFPSLDDVIVEDCSKMNIFSQGALSTPNLQGVWLTTVGDKRRWKGDLNATIKQLYADANPQ